MITNYRANDMILEVGRLRQAANGIVLAKDVIPVAVGEVGFLATTQDIR